MSKSITIKKLATLTLSTVAALGVSMTSLAAVDTHWVEDSSIWKYQLEDGTYAKSAWIKQIGSDNTLEYYVDKDGNMISSNWAQIDNKWYTFDSDGLLVTNKWIERPDKTWIYSLGDGNLTKGWQLIDNTWYFFSNYGTVVTGWIKDNDKFYYMNKDGSLSTGWVRSRHSGWHYLDPNDGGAMAASKEMDIDGVHYWFDSNGCIIK